MNGVVVRGPFRDHFSNGNNERSCIDAVQACTIFPDNRAPSLLGFSLFEDNADYRRTASRSSVHATTIVLTFSEPVAYDSFDLSNFNFYSDTSATSPNLTLSGGIVETQAGLSGSREVTVLLNNPDTAFLKLNDFIATSVENTYLMIGAGALNDTSGNPINTSPIIQASEVLSDDTAPQLVNFTIDLNTAQLNLTFDDVIDLNTFDIRGVTLQDAATATVAYTLRTAQNITTYDSYTVVIRMNSLELIDLKTLPGVGSNVNDTYITLAAFTIDDHRGTDVIAITDTKALQALYVVEDTTPPELLSFDLDLDSSMLFLTFSDSINLNTFNSSGLSLQNQESVMEVTDYYDLTGGSVWRSPLDASVLEVSITEDDLNEIKKNTLLATSEFTTYLSAVTETAEDAASNPLVPIPKSAGIMVSSLTNDTTGPLLRRFTLNLDTGILTLSFSETIRLSSYNSDGITILNRANISFATANHTLTGGIVLGTNGPDVLIQLSPFDLNTLKSYSTLATSRANTFIALDSFSFVDMSFNPAMPVQPSNSLQVSRVDPDITPPELFDYSLDLNTGTITFNFSEYIDPATFTPTEAQLQDTADGTGVAVTLTGGEPSSNLDTFTVRLAPEDLYQIQNQTTVAISEFSTFLSAGASFVQDASQNPMVPVSTLMVETLTPDVEGPYLVTFLLDLNANILELTFNEVVNVSSLTIGQIILQDTALAEDGNTSLALATSEIRTPNHYIQLIRLSDADKERIDVDVLLATEFNNTFINITEGGVFDMSRNAIEAFNASVQVGRYISDITGPILNEFSLDLNTGIFELYFSEAVDPATLILGELNITSTATGRPMEPTVHNLAFTPQPTGIPRSLISITLHNTDLNDLKYDIALTSNETEVSYPRGAFEDVYGNPTPGGSVSHPPLPDTTPPRLQSFDLDMDTNTLTLSFSETINISTFDLSAITIQNGALSSVQLSTPAALDVTSFSVVVVSLSSTDTDRIKALQDLAVDNSTTFLSATDELLYDTAKTPNQNVPVSGLPVSVYTPDTTPVQFLRFDLNLSSNVLTLYFDEPVEISSFNVTEFTLFDITNTSLTFSVTSAVLPTENTKQVEIRLDQEDVNVLNILPICTQRSDCYLNLTDSLTIDTVGNPLNFAVPVPALVDDFYPDRIPPQLDHFELLDLDEGLITLVFSESVIASTVMPISLNLTDWYQDNLRMYTLVLGG